ncbi:MAG: YajQ family cyclic di-GMP-binding protein [Bacilli bacterium]|nr:YajQ family cyclic di-GMP-binding protein [Bacilli bacterium]
MAAKDASFDIVSKVELHEVTNAVIQTEKEFQNRFDFKGSKCSIEQKGEEVIIVGDDEYKLGAVLDILESKLFKRGISLKSLSPGKLEPAAGGTVRQSFKIRTGIEQDQAKQIMKIIKDAKLKVQASIQGDQVRVTGKSRDDLQQVISLLKVEDLPIDLQFTNYR